jgi:putative FmdB family regulatory protein
MPIYTYRCNHCGVQFDKQQKFSDDPLKICPECNQPELRKLYLPVGIVFKGSGFYSTDHRSPSGQSTTSTDKKDKSEETSEGAGKEAASNKPSKEAD